MADNPVNYSAMSFNLGKPILVMIVLAGITGTGLLIASRSAAKSDVTLWVFAESHAKTYREPISTTRPSLTSHFQLLTGKSLNVELLSFNAENVRLGEMFMSDLRGPELPDLAEIEIGSVGRFFRPPANDIGFLPLNHYLETTGPARDGPRWIDLLVKSRLETWSKNGLIFGVPHDVHPVTITYRYDLFSQAGVDLEKCVTWPEFQEACLRFQEYWKGKAEHRHAMELNNATTEHLITMLLQRHLNPVDAQGNIYLTDPKFVQTVAFYAQLLEGPRQIAAFSGTTEGVIIRDIREGNICAFLTPDWKVSYIERYAGEDLKGKLRMMPLPVFDPSDAPTSTWGGTMIGISKNSPNPDLAWKAIELIYLSKEGIEARRNFVRNPAAGEVDVVGSGVSPARSFLYLGSRTGPMPIQMARRLRSFM